MTVKAGDTLSWSRTFTNEDILQFGELTGDQGRHHMVPDEEGRLMVHGLLTASIGTKIGGDMNYIAREMNSEFVRPVFAGDTITCELTVLNVSKHPDFSLVEVESIYKNQLGKEVIIAKSHGVIRDERGKSNDPKSKT